jgi:hypothetical protein
MPRKRPPPDQSIDLARRPSVLQWMELRALKMTG